ncbi:EamA family transporter [Lacticaseibacillus paracasei]|nr:EamA family transporter [Lacticaseibacillus paracasei]
MQLTSASISGLFYVIQPIVGTLLGWLLLQEQLTWGFLLGTVLIIGSVWLVTRFDV